MAVPAKSAVILPELKQEQGADPDLLARRLEQALKEKTKGEPVIDGATGEEITDEEELKFFRSLPRA